MAMEICLAEGLMFQNDDSMFRYYRWTQDSNGRHEIFLMKMMIKVEMIVC